jgi:hypothetical protein
MATTDNRTALANSPQPVAEDEPERLALRLVGNRNYVRALELVTQLRRRFSAGTLNFRFLRPMTCDVLITRQRLPGWSSIMTVQTNSSGAQRYFIVNVNSGNVYPAADERLPPHLVLSFNEKQQRYLILGADECKHLNVIFETYRKRTGLSPVITAIKMREGRQQWVQHVLVYVEAIKPRRLASRIWKNSHLWCKIDCVVPGPVSESTDI